ncbi:MAG: hypothetical protein WCV93_01865 [Candidatus Shapirobacteria bacterium]|jgi:hypothetical protein
MITTTATIISMPRLKPASLDQKITVGILIFLALVLPLSTFLTQQKTVWKNRAQTPTPQICPGERFGSFVYSIYYGELNNSDGQPLPQGTQVKFYSPRGELVGCGSLLNAPGKLAYTYIYGHDQSIDPSLFTGMYEGETPIIKVDEMDVTSTPQIVWQFTSTR